MRARDFTGGREFTKYMAVVCRIVHEGGPSQRVLDIPAGHGLVTDRLRESGLDVISADINRARPDYVYADLSKPIPFKNEEFDTVVCLEGIEHIVDPIHVIRELCRVTKKVAGSSYRCRTSRTCTHDSNTCAPVTFSSSARAQAGT
ncbi:MAG: class I SAM-dependent methyltransferase [Verrucomicrobiae bacterium]|nr:class I SAM-dependent methyltransferase [Verrucomicrobiae bacterium]MCX7722254.1 class I SAM-dependent methyltransferase [Verrucomicrobiae bacterium]MDW7980812.1 class I SAM-dependent methyltransferase [Verrucomicrobiales bacterium]